MNPVGGKQKLLDLLADLKLLDFLELREGKKAQFTRLRFEAKVVVQGAVIIDVAASYRQPISARGKRDAPNALGQLERADLFQRRNIPNLDPPTPEFLRMSPATSADQ